MNQKGPLFDLFLQLRRKGCNLGIDDYALFLRALSAGYGIKTKQELFNLCELLWLKTETDRQLLKLLFTDGIVHQKKNKGIDKTGELAADGEYSHDDEEKIGDMEQENNDNLVQPYRADSAVVDYDTTNDLFPFTKRQMKQGWRFIRKMVRDGKPEELDLSSTINQISRYGFFILPVLIPRKLDRIQIVFLIDRNGSMVPFHLYSQQLAHSARRREHTEETKVYYFHDYPDESLFRDIAQLNLCPVDEVISEWDDKVFVFIVSDAGAARGYFDHERVEQTKIFIQKVKKQVRHFAWLNPMPESRWRDTTATEICKLIPMFELNKQGLEAAIRFMRGHTPYGQFTRS